MLKYVNFAYNVKSYRCINKIDDCIALLYVQVIAEFELMCGNDAVTTIKTKWLHYIPKILRDQEQGDDEETQYAALDKINLLLRPPGAGAKSIPAVSIHEVCTIIITYYVVDVLCAS